MKIQQYKTNLGYFAKCISPNWTNLHEYIINDQQYTVLDTIKGWLKLPEEIKSVKRKTVTRTAPTHYKLKDEELAGKKLPLTVEHYIDEYDNIALRGVEGYESLYEPIVSPAIERIEEVQFEIQGMGSFEIEDPCNLKTRIVKLAPSGIYSKAAEEVDISKIVTYDELLELITPEFAMQQVPCKLSSHQMYRIVRQYLKENLDMKENSITSDYDFCFTVKKRVHTKPFIVNESYLVGKSKWKQKKVTKNEKFVEVFEMTYAGYKGKGGYEGYTCIPEMHANSLQELQDKLFDYLEGLVYSLNQAVNECECCGGTGAIVTIAKV